MASNKNNTWIKPRHNTLRNILAPVIGLYTRLKFGIKPEKFQDQGDRQFLIIMNHQTSFDQFFVSLSFRGPIYYIATEDLFSKGWISRAISYIQAPIPIRKQTTDIKAVKDCDALLLGGGSLLQDRTSTRSILYYLSMIHCAKRMGKRVVLYANGIGPVEKRRNRKRVKRAIDRVDLVTLRDRASAEELREMGVTNPNIHVTADPVFCLDPASDEASISLLEQAGLEADSRFVAVSVRKWPGSANFSEEMAAFCDDLRRTYNMEVLFLLMQPEKDREAAQQVRDAMEEPSYILDVPCSALELMGVLGKAKLCLAMRLHALIFAARMAVPALGLVYDPKVEHYLRELEMPSAGDVSDFNREFAICKANELMADYDAYVARMREKSRELSAVAEQNEKLLWKLLEERG